MTIMKTSYLLCILLILPTICLSFPFYGEIEQNLSGAGFHRNLTFSLTIKYTRGEKLLEGCRVCILQIIPSGVELDNDEIQELIRTEEIDMLVSVPRLPDATDNDKGMRSEMAVYGYITDDKANLWVPLHAKYQQAAYGKKFVTFIFQQAGMLVNCEEVSKTVDDPDMKYISYYRSYFDRSTIPWMFVPISTLSKTLTWKVPVGNVDHFMLVCVATSVAVIIGSLYIVKAINVFHKNNYKPE